MAITVVITNETDPVSLAVATSFSITEPTPILADNLAVDEYALVYRLGPSGEYKPATNKDGTIFLSWAPNTAVLDAAGTYKITKTLSSTGVYVGYGS